MFVEAHIIAFNESETIHLTVKHYQQFCQRIIIYDNFSTDNTREICEALGCEIKTFGIPGVLDDREYTKLKNNCWKGSNADWVIVCDADEILHFNDTDYRQALINYKELGYSVLKPHGWQVVSNEMPIESWFDVTTGFWYDQYSKMCCFDPHKITEMNYVHGCHVADPKGDVLILNGHTLLHYRKVGGPQRMIDRYKLYCSRISDWNKRWNAGEHYWREEQRLIKEWQEEYDRSGKYAPLGG